MFDRTEAARRRIRNHVGPLAAAYHALAERLMLMPDHPLRERAMFRLAESLDDAASLEEKEIQSPRKRHS